MTRRPPRPRSRGAFLAARERNAPFVRPARLGALLHTEGSVLARAALGYKRRNSCTLPMRRIGYSS
jgi:hypothetical protein